MDTRDTRMEKGKKKKEKKHDSRPIEGPVLNIWEPLTIVIVVGFAFEASTPSTIATTLRGARQRAADRVSLLWTHANCDPSPGTSINSNRINSSAVIVFCASQKAHPSPPQRLASFRTISDRVSSFPSPPLRERNDGFVNCDQWVAKKKKERSRNGCWASWVRFLIDSNALIFYRKIKWRI